MSLTIPGPYVSGSLLSVDNRTTFEYNPSKGTGLSPTQIRAVYDTNTTNSDVSLEELSFFAGLNKNTNIAYSDFDDHQMTAYGPFYHATVCGGVASNEHYRSKNIGGTPSGFYYSNNRGGRVNFLPNGPIFLSTTDITDPTKTNTINVITISNGKQISSTICTPNTDI